MHYYYPTRQPVLVRDADLHVERRLPVSGEVKVRLGDRVEPSQVVAAGAKMRRPILIQVARELEVDPAEARRRLTRELGSAVAADEVIARRRRGLRMRVVRTPVAGTLTAFDATTGAATVVPSPQLIELMAHVTGTIDDIEQTSGVTIRTFGSRFYGAFGAGDEAFGVLRVIGNERPQALGAEAIDNRSARAVVAAGGSVTAAALQKAVQVGVKGIIAGSIEERELSTFLKAQRRALWRVGLPDWRMPAAPSPLPIVVTEGFGQGTMAAPIFETLVAADGGQVSLSGLTRIAGGLSRPEVYLSASGRRAGDGEGLPIATLTPGAVVRLVDQDHLGAVGTVQAEPRRLRLGGELPVEAVEVALADGNQLVVPTANLEVLT